jgi:signal transduction histidine kinase
VGRQVTYLEAETADRGPGQSQDHEAVVNKACHRRRDGSPVHVLVHRRDVLDERGREIAHLYVVEDLTERERMEDQLLYAEKLSLLGQLAPRIAHEFKSPLQLIFGHAELIRQWLKAGDPAAAHESAGHIIPAAEKLLELVRQMLDLGKPEQTREETLDLEAELEKALAPLLHLGVIKHCRIERDYAAGLPRVRGDSAQLGQVLGNLIINAAQAMEKQMERVLTLGLSPSVGGLGVELTVGDTGCGMPTEDLERVFQPFYTTKPEGTGLGLAIVRTVLDRHRATVAVTSEEGVGTRFVLSFPGVSPPPAG